MRQTDGKPVTFSKYGPFAAPCHLPALPRGIPVTPPVSRTRIDRLLVERGLFESRAQAQAAIGAGRVRADDVVVTKPSAEIAPEAVIRAEPGHPFVSRGAVKLAHALDHFRFNPSGRVCLDVGASTGGFTEILLSRGARCIYAVDVGHDQLHRRLRAQPNVISLEGTDIRRLQPAQLPEPPDFISIDVSFISLQLVLPPALTLAKAPARLVALIKPQFEAGRRAVKKGLVRDPAVHAAVCESISARVQSLGWRALGIVASPIVGGDGNREFLLGAARD
jgi:23S rRNA (cytidine1920-2'-O)/16S rRNA (cytidine1409-2'-O)-methyltransferase